MKRLVLLLAALVGCDVVGPTTTALNFKFDGASCFDLGSPQIEMDLIVDGSVRLTQALAIEEVSDNIRIRPGEHSATGRETLSGYVWPIQRVTVSRHEVRTVLLRC